MLTGWNIIEIGRLIRDLVLRPGVGVVSRIVRLNPRVAISDGIGGFRTGKSRSFFSSDESSGSSGCCWSGIIGGLKG